MTQRFGTRVSTSFVGPLAAFGLRASHLLRKEARHAVAGAKWVLSSREHSNFTYDLTHRSMTYLAAFVSVVAARPLPECQGYISELLNDQDLRQHISEATDRAPRGRISNRHVHVGRRAGWYALIRAVRPEHVVETGTDKGLGSVVLASALIKNGSGHLTTIDTNPLSGFLISGCYANVTDRLIASSLEELGRLEAVDVFIHDSDHRYAYEMAEYQAVESRLTEDAFVLSDNSEGGTALFDWSYARSRRFLSFREEPAISALEPEGYAVSWRG